MVLGGGEKLFRTPELHFQNANEEPADPALHNEAHVAASGGLQDYLRQKHSDRSPPPRTIEGKITHQGIPPNEYYYSAPAGEKSKKFKTSERSPHKLIGRAHNAAISSGRKQSKGKKGSQRRIFNAAHSLPKPPPQARAIPRGGKHGLPPHSQIIYQPGFQVLHRP